MHKEIWDQCLSVIREKISDQAFRTWFQPIVALKVEGKSLTIQVPSQFFYEWLEENYWKELKEALGLTLGTGARLEYSIIIDKGSPQQKPLTVKLNGQDGNLAPEKNTTLSVWSSRTPNLNPNYRFENFLEGSCNRIARNAGYAIVEKPGTNSFNPLMVWGGVGMGKTHLVQAIGNEIKRNFSHKNVRYVASEVFTSQFIEAHQNRNLASFMSFYSDVDVLILDDVQFLSDKEKTQEIFFHIFNQLHQSGKQIVLTSDCPPKDLKGLQERLLSRFKWGLTVEIQDPDFDMRKNIILKKVEADGIHIHPQVIDYVAYSVDSNIRELEGVIISLIAHASLTRRNIDLELARIVLNNIVQETSQEVGIDYIQKTVSEYFHVNFEELKAKTRKKEVVIARQVAMYFSKDYTNHSLKTIGYHFGGRDHSTVIHALQSVSDMMDTDHKFRYNIEELKKKMKIRTTVH